MKKDRQRWNRKYEKHDYSLRPSQIVKDFYMHATPGNALDIATGMGRNAYFLAQHGFQVEAVDIADVAINQFKNCPGNLRPACVDLDTFDIPKERYNLILNIRFINRKFFSQIVTGLVPGGVIIFETYLAGDKGSEGVPSCRDYLLQPNELLRAFSDLRILFYREALLGSGDEARPIASLVAIKGLDCKLMPTPH